MAENKLHRFCDNGNTIKVAMMQDVAGLDWEAVPIAPHGDPLHDDNSWVIADTFDKVPVPETGSGVYPSCWDGGRQARY